MRIIKLLYASYHLFMGLHKGILAIMLGVFLIIDPDKSEPKLTYMMGMFWLASGFGLLRQDPDERMNSCSSKLISVVAILTGLLVVARYYFDRIFDYHMFDDVVVSVILGVVILLTGLAHLYADLIGGDSTSHRILHILLALFEVFLGVQLLLLPLVGHEYVRQTITAWALVGGILFLSTAFYDWSQRNEKEKDEDEAADTDADATAVNPDTADADAGSVNQPGEEQEKE